VILYNVVRPYNLPVAKGTVQTTNPSSIVGDTLLAFNIVSIVFKVIRRPKAPDSLFIF
jgi:hypothetical protein